MSYLVGVDVGGTSVKLGLIQYGVQFSVIKQTSIPTRPQDAAMVFAERIAAAVKGLVEETPDGQVAGIGVGCPGLIDPWNGIVRTSPNLKNLPGFELRKNLAGLTGLPVEIQNDANAAVLGEWLFSPSSKDVKNMVLLTLGTGVGGGVVCDAHLLVGAANAATELGHVKVEYHNGAPCGCGKDGCVEAYAGVAGIRRIANDLIRKGTKTTLTGGEGLTTRDISIAASQGDEVGKKTLFTVGVHLGRAIATFLETFNPEKVVLGGGASAAIEHMMPGINASLDECSSFAFTRNMCKIERSAFPDDINVIGAAATYLNSHR
jgi:glucokinase